MIHGKAKQMFEECELCGGDGWVVDVVTEAECCMQFDKYGGCCNNPIAIPKQVQIQCPNCGGEKPPKKQ